MPVHIPPERPNLAPPGAGMSTIPRLLMKYVGWPAYSALVSTEDVLRAFDQHSDRILAKVEGLDEETLATRVLVKPMIALEDDSRWWSVAMALEHLIIVDREVADAVVRLSRGETIHKRVTIPDVKPGQLIPPARVVDEFRTMLGEFRARMAQSVRPLRTDTTFEHPWFGPLTAHRWLCVAAAHQGLHGRQISAILRGLGHRHAVTATAAREDA